MNNQLEKARLLLKETRHANSIQPTDSFIICEKSDSRPNRCSLDVDKIAGGSSACPHKFYIAIYIRRVITLLKCLYNSDESRIEPVHHAYSALHRLICVLVGSARLRFVSTNNLNLNINGLSSSSIMIKGLLLNLGSIYTLLSIPTMIFYPELRK